jgi:DNA-binding transcriptional ArsR family regulator
MAGTKMTPELLALIAARFRGLAEPARLEILNALRDGEKTVTELVEETGMGQANVSKHLQVLSTLGFVSRRKQGLYVYCTLTDKDVFRLCDIMCGRLESELKSRRRILAAG